jgi:hypothetical protein
LPDQMPASRALLTLEHADRLDTEFTNNAEPVAAIRSSFIGASVAATYRALSPEMVMIHALPVSLSASPGLGLSAVRAGLRATSGVALLAAQRSWSRSQLPTAPAAAGTTSRRSRKGSAGAGSSQSRARTRTTTTSTRPRRCRSDSTPRFSPTRRRRRCGRTTHPEEAPLWEDDPPRPPTQHGTRRRRRTVHRGDRAAGAVHPGTPPARRGSTPGSSTPCTGDTLFQGGPGATGLSFFSFDTIIESIPGRLLTLPGDTTVRTGHGDSTTVGAEAPHLDKWIAQRH